MPKKIKTHRPLFFVLAFIVFAAAASLLIFNPLKAQPRAGANACTDFGNCLENDMPPIGQLNGKFCASSGEKISDADCACNNAPSNSAPINCTRQGYKCVAGSHGVPWGHLSSDANCNNFVCVASQCTACNQRCNSSGNASVYDASCSSLCTLSYVNNQMSTAQDASFWLNNDGKLGPDNNNYIYFDPTVSDTSQNSLYVNSNDTAGNFIKLDVSNQEKFKVDKDGNAYMNNLYVNNIVNNSQTGELDSWLYTVTAANYRPYFAATYQFNIASQQKPSGSGQYLFVGANTTGGTAKIYVIKMDTGEIVSTASSVGYNVAGLGVVMESGNYVLYAAIADTSSGDRGLKKCLISMPLANNYEPTIGSCSSSVPGYGGKAFYILPVANILYITDNVNNRVYKYYPAQPGATIYASLGTYKPYALVVQQGAEPALWATASYESGGSYSGRLFKRKLIDLTEIHTANLGSNCPVPKLMAVDKYNNIWTTCSNTQYYYSQNPWDESKSYISRYNSTTYEQSTFNVPYYTGGGYQYSGNSLPFGIYYHPSFEQILVGNRTDGRIYRLTLSGELVNCDGTMPESLDNLEACVINNGDPVGQLVSSHPLAVTDSYWVIDMAATTPSVYRGWSMETLYTGDLFSSGNVASFGFFLQGTGGGGHEKLLIDLSGYNDKISFVGYQTNVGQTGDRAGMYFFGDNSGSSEYDLGQFIVQSEVINLGPNYNGAAAANSAGTLNKGQIYLRGMTTLGTDASLSNPLLLASGENLLYGNINSGSTGGNLILLQNGSQDKFKVDKDGNTTVSGNLTVTGNISDSDSDVIINDSLSVANALKTPGGLEVLGSDLNTSCTTVPVIKTDGTMYVCKWCASRVQHRELRVWLLNSWYTIRDNTNSVTNCNSI